MNIYRNINLALLCILFHSSFNAQTGSTCANANVISLLPYAQLGMTTCGFSSDYGPADACGGAYMVGDDYVYSYTPPINAAIDILLTNTLPTASVFLLDGCPDAAGTNCIASEIGANPSLACIPVTGGTTYYIVVASAPLLLPPPAPPIFCGGFNITIQESPGGGSAPTCDLDYTFSTISHSPAGYSSGTSLTFSDDTFSPFWVNFGFSFCFDGVLYTQCLISANGYITFPGCFGVVPGGDPNPSGYSPYSIGAAIPNITDAPGNSILLTWQDTNPGVGGGIRFETTGTSPNKVFILKFDDVPMYGCGSSPSSNYSAQLMLYETSNLIEFHITQRTACASWQGGAGIMGINSYDGTTAVIAPGPPNHNYPTLWSESNTGYRISPNCTGSACSIALPITLMDFTGESLSFGNVLEWSTSSEINNDYFILEKSHDGSRYEKIGVIDGAATSNEINHYEFIDSENLQGQTYYRLKQVNFDEEETVSSIIVVTRESEISVNLFPNPTNDNIHISIDVEAPVLCKIEISNILGLVKETSKQLIKGNNTFTLQDFNELPKGIYSIKMMNKTSEIIAVRKVIKK